MKKRISEAAYKKAFLAKVKLARQGAGYSADEIASLLGISLDKYYRYESRHMMRQDLIIPFCQITKTDLDKLMAPPAAYASRKSA